MATNKTTDESNFIVRYNIREIESLVNPFQKLLILFQAHLVKTKMSQVQTSH